jgi:hypothetical protein
MSYQSDNTECQISIDHDTLSRHGGAVVGSIDQGTSSTRYIIFNTMGEG